MIFYRVGVPLIIVALLALIALVLIYWRHRRDEDIRREEKLAAEKRWTGSCEFDNPDTGAKCQREEFHWENHYREINGRLVHW